MRSKTDEKQTDRELLRLAKSGDYDAFQRLIGELQSRVYGMAFRILHQAQDAEDATQQAFLSLIEHIDDFREESSVATWVMRIAANHALKILRKRRGLPTISASQWNTDDSYQDVPHPEFIAPWSETSEEIVQRAEVQQSVEKALLELDDKYRSVFVLRDIEGFSVRETAQALDITESNVKVRLLRARLALRERLTNIFGDATKAMRPNHQHS